jgi:hypothetical protein
MTLGISVATGPPALTHALTNRDKKTVTIIAMVILFFIQTAFHNRVIG